MFRAGDGVHLRLSAASGSQAVRPGVGLSGIFGFPLCRSASASIASEHIRLSFLLRCSIWWLRTVPGGADLSHLLSCWFVGLGIDDAVVEPRDDFQEPQPSADLRCDRTVLRRVSMQAKRFGSVNIPLTARDPSLDLQSQLSSKELL